MAISFISNEEISLVFEHGFAQAELLPGVYPLVRSYRGMLQAGCSREFPALPQRAFAVYCFTQGQGYAAAAAQAYNIRGLSFFVPDPAQPFSLHAGQDIVYTSFVVTMLDSDWEEWNETHCVLPFFKTLDRCEPYWQSCKSANTQSWYVICRKLLPRTIMGVCRALGPGREGTAETGHPNVAQWNVMLPGADIELTVCDETISHRAGDFSYVPAGLPHALISRPGKLNYYIWFEHFVKELPPVSWQP